ncbi:MAG: NADH-quinone oxidoreductase subunit J [Deltaproteobacteria bacterium]|nr:MAG: NADH-quinone oxidoreductase subunit J [Deltaproteobacteria bacterium]
MTAPVFLLLAVLVVAAALTVVAHPSPVYSACALVVTLFLLSVFFVALDAQLVAVLQVIVYAGAIVVLFLFVIMLLNLTQPESRPTAGVPVVAVAVGGGIGIAALVAAALRRVPPAGAPALPEGFGDTAALARRLFTAYVLPFELTSVLLLVAIVGAVGLASRKG